VGGAWLKRQERNGLRLEDDGDDRVGWRREKEGARFGL
jgi:hypothetical protein